VSSTRLFLSPCLHYSFPLSASSPRGLDPVDSNIVRFPPLMATSYIYHRGRFSPHPFCSLLPPLSPTPPDYSPSLPSEQNFFSFPVDDLSYYFPSREGTFAHVFLKAPVGVFSFLYADSSLLLASLFFLPTPPLFSPAAGVARRCIPVRHAM